MSQIAVSYAVDDPRTSTSGRSTVFGYEYPQPRYTGSVDESAVYLDQYDLGLIGVVTNLMCVMYSRRIWFRRYARTFELNSLGWKGVLSLFPS